LIERKTQSPQYWASGFSIQPEDLQYLSTLLIEDELPLSAEDLGRALVLHRVRAEEAIVEQVVSQGRLYQPKESYEVGETLVFPALGYGVGEVVKVRAGRNPEHGKFRVVKVDLEGDKKREFASELETDHVLNREGYAPVADESLLSPEELADTYGEHVGGVLEKRLEEEPDFVRLAGSWFRRDLLVEVNAGHLNLAEAVLDVAAGGPLPTADLLGDLELPEEITSQLRVFSLNYALQEDDRFDEVGPAGEVMWFLRRLQPEGVQSVPAHLTYEPEPYDAEVLTSEMIALEEELDDEWSERDVVREPAEQALTVLGYSHWRCGTLPLSRKLAGVFPTGRTHRIRFTFVDKETGAEFPGWVVREGRYVSGLGEWYEEKEIPVGAYLELRRGDKPGNVIVGPTAIRPRREWIRVALPVDRRLTFEMRKQLVPCDYDELRVLAVEDLEAMDDVWDRIVDGGLSVGALVGEIFPELAKLSPQGTVHAATLYTAVNAVKRLPPGPMLAVLAESGVYSPVGHNYWVLRQDPEEE
jgi:hypothetical protein